jgi:hypothetical protein
MNPDRLIAISVLTSAQEQRDECLEATSHPVELRTVLSPYRDLTGPLLKVIDELDAERSDDVVTVVSRSSWSNVVGATAAQPERIAAAHEAAQAAKHGSDLGAGPRQRPPGR